MGYRMVTMTDYSRLLCAHESVHINVCTLDTRDDVTCAHVCTRDVISHVTDDVT